MTAVQACIRLHAELGVMIGGNVITGQCQIVILIDKADIDTRGARLAMVAINAGSADRVGGKTANDRIILFLSVCGGIGLILLGLAILKGK